MIILSPGHNYYARGASYEGFNEYPETLLWAELIAEKIDSMGLLVTVIRENTLKNKTEKINDICLDEKHCLAVEIHFNAVNKGKPSGCEVLYYEGSKGGELLANSILNRIADTFAPNRGAKEAKGFMFLRATRCPAVIVEVDFVYNYKRIFNNCQKGCLQIAEGIAQAYNIFYERGN